MTIDATKKQPTTEISELQELELEYQIRLRAYQLYEARGREDGHELEDWFRAKRRSQSRNSEPLPPESHSRAKVENIWPRSGAFFTSPQPPRASGVRLPHHSA